MTEQNDTITISFLEESLRLSQEQADLSEAICDRIELDNLQTKTRKIAERFKAREVRKAQRSAERAGAR